MRYINPISSNYPPAEPGALGLLAPRRGLTAILTTKTPRQDMYFLNYKSLHDSLANFEKRPTEFSKCFSPPAEPGVYLNEIT